MPYDELGNYLHKRVYRSTMGADTQTIPARHGTATFVPAGSTIKIINTSGTQVIDTWAFALPSPPSKGEGDSKQEKGKPNGKPQNGASKGEDSKQDAKRDSKQEPKQESKQEPKQEPKQDSKQEPKEDNKPATPKPTPKRTKSRKDGMNLPSQEEAERATSQAMQEKQQQEAQNGTPSKKGWSSYIPSVNLRGSKTDDEKKQVKENSRGWSQYFSAGQGFTNYIPSKKALSAFANSHYRDPKKPIIQQLTDFSRTPVGAAGISALSGQGYASSLYAGYSAWTGASTETAFAMEFLSMPHTRTSTCHLTPKIGDVLVSNLREPMMTVLEDTSGVHDTLIAACDPQRYRQLGVENWIEHGSCAENLVLALKELNERAGLEGAKGIGADVTVNAVPPPLNLFMNIPWTNDGELSFDSPKAKKGDYVRFRAERDVVVIMSACPQDVLDINSKQIQDAEFIVEEELDQASESIRKRLETSSSPKKKPAPAKRGAPRKLNSGGSKAAGKKPAAASASKPSGASESAASAEKKATKAATGGQNGSRRASQATTTQANGTGGGGGEDEARGQQQQQQSQSQPQQQQQTERKKPRKIQRRNVEAN
ncbi:hypothetical protein ANO11243_058530 [Dothideomycetidae sp. 11243]|nr:hypothetical protein ANO11243_058530 [fungal sp. No.11243]